MVKLRQWWLQSETSQSDNKPFGTSGVVLGTGTPGTIEYVCDL
jgi:hypothetical protein